MADELIETEPEQRASWLELFFDLVVVVAVASLTARLHHHTGWANFGIVVVLYLAVWLVWTSFMLYANVAADNTHRRAMLMAMGCIAVMAAAVPDIENRARGAAFAAAYLIARTIAGRAWGRTARALLDWPIAQMQVGLAPWIASFWFDGTVRYCLWGVGVLLDLGFAIFRHDNVKMLQRMQHETHRGKKSWRQNRAARKDPLSVSQTPHIAPLSVTHVNSSHFEERLGTFMIIVLGEAVTQLVTASSNATWTREFQIGAAAGFMLLFGLWWLTFQYGFSGSAAMSLTTLPTRIAMLAHLFLTASVMVMAAGLGSIVESPERISATELRWLACTGVAVYFAVVGLRGLVVRVPRKWLLGWGLPAVVVPILVAEFGQHLLDWAILVILALTVGWQAAYHPVQRAIGASVEQALK